MRAYILAQATEAALVESVVDRTMAGAEGANCGDDVRVLREAIAEQKRGNLSAAEAGFARAEMLHEADRQYYADLDVPFRELGFERLLSKAKANIAKPQACQSARKFDP